MKKNVASQKIGGQMVSATDGSAFTGSVTVAVTGDAGTQATGSVGSGACTHEGNGYHTYAPAQAETNYDLIAFTFTGSGAVPATVQVYTDDLNAIADNILDRSAGVETNRTLRQALRLILSTAVGKLSGAGTTTVTIRDSNDGVSRVVATVDSSGNRSAVTLDAS